MEDGPVLVPVDRRAKEDAAATKATLPVPFLRPVPPIKTGMQSVPLAVAMLDLHYAGLGLHLRVVGSEVCACNPRRSVFVLVCQEEAPRECAWDGRSF